MISILASHLLTKKADKLEGIFSFLFSYFKRLSLCSISLVSENVKILTFMETAFQTCKGRGKVKLISTVYFKKMKGVGSWGSGYQYIISQCFNGFLENLSNWNGYTHPLSSLYSLEERFK